MLATLLLACTAISCSPINPLSAYPNEVAQAEASHVPALIYVTTFGIYYDSEHARKRSVSFINTSGRAINVLLVGTRQCISVSGDTSQTKWSSYIGPFVPGSYYTVESYPAEGVKEREIIVGIRAQYVDGPTETYTGNIASALTANVVNHCPTSIYRP